MALCEILFIFEEILSIRVQMNTINDMDEQLAPTDDMAFQVANASG